MVTHPALAELMPGMMVLDDDRDAQEAMDVRPTPLVAPGVDDPPAPAPPAPLFSRGRTAGAPDRERDVDDEPGTGPLPRARPAAAASVDGEAATYYRERPWPAIGPPADDDPPKTRGRRWPAAGAGAAAAGLAAGAGGAAAGLAGGAAVDPPTDPPERPWAASSAGAGGVDAGSTFYRERPWSPPAASPSPAVGPSPGPGPAPRPRTSDMSAHPMRLALVASAVVIVVAAVGLAFVTSKGDKKVDTGAPGSLVQPVAEPTTAGPATTNPTSTSTSTSTPAQTPTPTRAPGGGGGTPGPTSQGTTPATSPPSEEPQTPETIVVVEPAGGEVPRCYVFRGRAGLRPGRALVVRVGNHFEPVTSCDGAGNFSRSQYFGDDSAVGQTFTASFLVVDSSALQAAQSAHGSSGAWDDASSPAGAQQIHTVTVRRIAGAGSC